MKRANGIAAFVAAGSLMQWTFGEGLTVRYDVADNFPEFGSMDDCQQRIVLNGVKQRLADSIAGCKLASDRFERMNALADAMRRGEYEMRAKGVATDAMLAAAIAIVKGIDLAKVTAYLATKTPSQRQALAADEKYHAKYLELLAQRTKSVDVDELDDEIDQL